MSLPRRNFIKLISLGTLATAFALPACTHRKFYNPDQDILLGGGQFNQNNQLRQVLAVVNLQQQNTQLIDLDFLAHEIIIAPKNKKHLISFEKNGRHGAVIDLDKKVVTQKIAASDDHIFSGHGTFNATGDIVFHPEINSKTNAGSICIRDSRSQDILERFPSFGQSPHQCRLIDNAKTLVVCNTGSAEINYIDVESQKLIERVSLSNPQLNAGHFDIANDGRLIVSSAAKTDLNKTNIGGVSIGNIKSGESEDGKNKNTLLSMTKPEAFIDRMIGEALSIAIDNKRNIAAITHPYSNMVSFWSIDKGELLKAMSVPQPRGITTSLDGKSFILSYHKNTSIILLNTSNFTAHTDSIMQPSYISGEHIYNWSKILTEIMPNNIY